MGSQSEELLLVRATVHLRGLRVSETVFVDPAEPRVAEYLAAGFLVPVETPPEGG